jgi:hypothetical protein
MHDNNVWCRCLTDTQVTHVPTLSESRQEFLVYRRFSDFDDVHQQARPPPHHLSRSRLQIKEKYAASKLSLPEKTIFGNHSQEFLLKRMDALRTWLAAALQPEYMAQKDTRTV